MNLRSTPRLRFRVGATVSALLVLLSGCSPVNSKTSDSRANPDGIQQALRAKAYDKWDSKFVSGEGSAGNQLNVDFDSSVLPNEAAKKDDYAPAGIDINKWRAEITDPWAEVPDNKLNMLCEIWFEWFMNPDDSDSESDVTRRFIALRENLAQISFFPYSVDQVMMVQDNRKTIPYPREGKPSYLFVCRAEITFDTKVKGFVRSYVFLSARYVLKDGKAVFSFPQYEARDIK